MRHFRQAGAVAPLTRGMGATTRPAGLIALARRPQRGPPGRLRADRPAVALAAVTTAANQKLQTTLGTMAQAGQRKFHGHLRPVTKGPPGRRPHLRRILSLQPCPARLGRGSGADLAIRCRCRARPFGQPVLRLSLSPVSNALFRDDPGHEGLKTPATGTPARSRPAQVGHPDLLPLSSPRPSALLPGEGCSGSPGAGRGKTRNLTAVAADSVGITREGRQRPWGQAGDNPLMRVAPSLPPLLHPLPPLRRATPPSA